MCESKCKEKKSSEKTANIGKKKIKVNDHRQKKEEIKNHDVVDRVGSGVIIL